MDFSVKFSIRLREEVKLVVYVVLSIVLYFIPIAILVYMALEIYFRNKNNLLNRITAVLLTMFSMLFFGGFMTSFLPATYYIVLSLYFKYIPAFCIMGIVLHFSMRLTSRFNRLSRLQALLICYTPALPALLLLYPSKWITLTYITAGEWKYDKPSFTLMVIIFSAAVYTLGVCLYLVVAGIRYVHSRPALKLQRQQLNMIMISSGASGVWAILSIFIPKDLLLDLRFNFPDFGALSMLIFAFFVRFVMIRYSFLPSIERKYQILYDLSPLAILLLDQEARIKEANPAALKLFDLTAKEIRSYDFTSLLVVKEQNPVISPIDSIFLKKNVVAGEYEVSKNSRDTRVVTAESEYIVIDGESFQYVILRDITESRAAEEKIIFMAYHDGLTGLPNRDKFHQQLSLELENVAQSPLSVAVMLMDLDRFKQINDTKGHYVGDMLLKYVATQLMSTSIEKLFVARLGGDEFALFLPGVENEENVQQFAQKILDSVKNPFIYEGDPYYITSSLGICLSPLHGTNTSNLLKYADIAMYHAKNSGRDRYQIYTDHINLREMS